MHPWQGVSGRLFGQMLPVGRTHFQGEPTHVPWLPCVEAWFGEDRQIHDRQIKKNRVLFQIGSGVLCNFGADLFSLFLWLPSFKQKKGMFKPFCVKILGVQFFAQIFAPVLRSFWCADICADFCVDFWCADFVQVFRRIFFDFLEAKYRCCRVTQTRRKSAEKYAACQWPCTGGTPVHLCYHSRGINTTATRTRYSRRACERSSWHLWAALLQDRSTIKCATDPLCEPLTSMFACNSACV